LSDFEITARETLENSTNSRTFADSGEFYFGVNFEELGVGNLKNWRSSLI
jgi:hypothetical protein